jgi:hypothetical protein
LFPVPVMGQEYAGPHRHGPMLSTSRCRSTNSRLRACYAVANRRVCSTEEERSRAAKMGLWLTGALQQVAIGALGGAGGNLMTG